jgi:hypothetical protein
VAVLWRARIVDVTQKADQPSLPRQAEAEREVDRRRCSCTPEQTVGRRSPSLGVAPSASDWRRCGHGAAGQAEENQGYEGATTHGTCDGQLNVFNSWSARARLKSYSGDSLSLSVFLQSALTNATNALTPSLDAAIATVSTGIAPP